MKVKICGIRTLGQAQKIYNLKPDAIGVLVGFSKKLAFNVISTKRAKQIVREAPEDIETFLLTNKTDAESNISYCRAISNKCLQLTADISPGEIYKIKTESPHVKIIKSIHIDGEETIKMAKLYESYDFVDELLLDSKVGRRTGGTGLTHDWNISRKIVEKCKKPVWLAGGLNPRNLREAILTVKPYGVDVETGIQNPNGSKNYELIREFIKIAKLFR